MKVFSVESFTFAVMKGLSIFVFFLLISFQSFSGNYTVFTENGKVGLKDELGQVLIPPQHEEIGWSNGEFSVINNVTGIRNGKLWGLINLANHRLTKLEFEELLPGEGGLIIAKKKPRNSVRVLAGCINSAGKEVIPFQYDGIIPGSLRVIVFTRIGNDFRYGLVDFTNRTIIPQQYQDIRSLGTLRFAVKNFDGKIALFSDQGKQVSDFSIDSVGIFQKDVAIFFEGSLRGLIDRSGQIRLPAAYRDIVVQDDGTFKVRKTDSWSFHDGANRLVKQFAADSIQILGPDLYKIKTASQAWLANGKFQKIGSRSFSHIGPFNDGSAIVKSGAEFGLIAADGKVLMEPVHQSLRATPLGLIAVQQRGSETISTLFDSSGKRKSVKSYEEILPFNNDLLAVRNRKYWGVIDKSGKEIITCVHDSLIQVLDDLVVVKFHGLYGIMNTQEKWIATPGSNKLSLIGGSRYLEHTREATKLKTLEGTLVYFTSNPVKAVEGFLMESTSTGEVWKIDLNGVIVDRQYYVREAAPVAVYPEAEGYRVIQRNGRFGFVDSKGRLRIANRYEDVRPFSEGLAAVKILGKWGFINLADNITVQPVYEQVFPFVRGRAVVKQKGLFGLIDNTGKLILPVRYERIELLPSGNRLIISNGLAGLADNSGNILIAPRFDRLADTGEQYAVVQKGGKYGVVSYQGISTIPLVYSYITYDPYENLFLALEKNEWEIVK